MGLTCREKTPGSAAIGKAKGVADTTRKPRRDRDCWHGPDHKAQSGASVRVPVIRDIFGPKLGFLGDKALHQGDAVRIIGDNDLNPV